MIPDYSCPQTFTREEPTKARDTCFACPCHDFLAKYPGHSCDIARLQTWWWTDSNNLVIRPVQSLCTNQAAIDALRDIRESSAVSAEFVQSLHVSEWFA